MACLVPDALSRLAPSAFVEFSSMLERPIDQP
jgi:hypothetical protein